MISDTLSDAVTQIDYYLAEPAFAKTYDADIAAKIKTVRDAMDNLRSELDGAPVSGGEDMVRNALLAQGVARG